MEVVMFFINTIKSKKSLLIGTVILLAYLGFEEKDLVLSLIIPAWHNIVNDDFKDSVLNKTYFWVFSKPILDSIGTNIYSGINFWNGYCISIEIFQDTELAKHDFILTKNIRSHDIELDSTVLIESVNDSTYYYSNMVNNKRISRVFYRSKNIIFDLDQVCALEKYKDIQFAENLIKEFL